MRNLILPYHLGYNLPKRFLGVSMWLDQWLVKKIAAFLYFRYHQSLQTEVHKWQTLAERERLQSLLRQLGAAGKSIRLRPGVQIIGADQVKMGSYVGIGNYTILRGLGGITIGNFVLIGDNVIITSVGHPIGGVYYRSQELAPVTISDNVWLAANVIILPGVTVGENSAVGAGAIVTEDIPPNSVAVGVPARVVRQFEPNLEQIEARKAALRAKFEKIPQETSGDDADE
jgi:acetyltransferase-like isoleucine patch superfamily enzyme